MRRKKKIEGETFYLNFCNTSHLLKGNGSIFIPEMETLACFWEEDFILQYKNKQESPVK